MNNFNKNQEEKFAIQPGEYNFDNINESFSEKIKKRNDLINKKALEKYMPIGSIIRIDNFIGNLMIVGFKYSLNGLNYDYMVCEFPYGISSEHGVMGINHEQIKSVYHIGYVNEQEEYFKSQLSENDDKTNMMGV